MFNFRLATLSETYQPKRLDPSKMAAFATKEGTPYGSNNRIQMATNLSLKQTEYERNGLVRADGNEYVTPSKTERSLLPNLSANSDSNDILSTTRAEKPKLELIEDEGQLDLLFQQIRKQKGYYEEEKQNDKVPAINRLSIPEAFSGTKETKINTGSTNLVPRHPGYDNVSLYSPEELKALTEDGTSEQTLCPKGKVASIVKPRPTEGQVKKVSFQDQVNTFGDQGAAKVKHISQEGTEKISKMTDYNQNWQEVKTVDMSDNTRNGNTGRHINHFGPLSNQLYTPPNRLNKLLPEDKVPVDRRKHLSNTSIDVNNLASYDNDLNIIHRSDSVRQNSLYSLISSDRKNSACNSKGTQLMTNKAQLKWRNEGTVNSNNALKSSGNSDSLFHLQLKDTRSTPSHHIKPSSSYRPPDGLGSSSIHIGSESVTSENSNTDFLKNKDKFEFDFNSVRSDKDVPVIKKNHFSEASELSLAVGLNSKGIPVKDQPTPATLKNTSPRILSKGLFVQPQETRAYTKKVGNDNDGLKVVTKTSTHDSTSETRDVDITNTHDLLSKEDLTKIPSLSGNVIDNRDILNKSLNYNLNMSNFHDSNIGSMSSSEFTPTSSLSQTRAIFEQQKGQQVSNEKHETIRKVGKLNIRQGPDAMSRHAIKERHGQAPSSMSIKMKKQLEDVLGRTPSLPTPIDSRKGSSVIEANNTLIQRRISENSQEESPRLIDSVNNDISTMKLKYERSDSGTSEGSSRDSIKQELEVLLGQRGQNGGPPLRKVSLDSKNNTTSQLSPRYADIDRESSTKSSPRYDSDMVFGSDNVSPQVIEFKRTKLPQDLKSLFERKQSGTPYVTSRSPALQQNSRALINNTEEVHLKQTNHTQQSQPLLESHGDSFSNSISLQEPVVSSITATHDSFDNMNMKKLEMLSSVDESQHAPQNTAKPGGVRKLNIPGLFLSSAAKEETPSNTGKLVFKTNKRNDVATVDSKITDQVTRGNILQKKETVAFDKEVPSTTKVVTLEQETLREKQEESGIKIPPLNSNDYNYIGSNSNANHKDDKTVLSTDNQPVSKAIGKLNMGNFSMFGQNGSRERTEMVSGKKTPRLVEQRFDKFKKTSSETIESSIVTKETSDSEPMVIPQVSSEEASFPMLTKQTSMENQKFSTNELVTEKIENVLDKQSANRSRLSIDKTNVWTESSYVSPVSNIRRGKVMMPGAFAVSDQNTTKKDQGIKVARPLLPRKTADEEKATPLVISNIKTENFMTQNMSDIPTSSSTQALDLVKDSFKNTAEKQEPELRFSLNSQYTEEKTSLEEQIRHPKRLAIPNVFSQSQSKSNQVPKRDIKPLHQVEDKTANENIVEEPLFIFRRPEETTLSDTGTNYRKVGRLAIPNMFGESTSKKAGERNVAYHTPSTQGNQIITKSNTDVAQASILRQNSESDGRSPNFVEPNFHTGVSSDERSFPEPIVSLESHKMQQEPLEDTNREEEKGGFISPRRSNVNRNRYIGKIAVPNIFH